MRDNKITHHESRFKIMDPKETQLNIPIKPPTIYFLSILAGLLLQWIVPIKLFSPFLIIVGLLLIASGVFINVWSDRLFSHAETAVNPDTPPTTLVTTGIYQYTRNPMYLGLTLLQIGIALVLNNFWLIITLLPTLTIMTYKVIHKEEAFLEATFGQMYLDYKATVRRWL